MKNYIKVCFLSNSNAFYSRLTNNYKIDMKGISAMIATVLLIAFTVAVGGILSVWFSSFTRTSTAQVENSSVDVTKCSSTYIDVTMVTSNGIVITNRGTQTINTITCVLSNGTQVPAIGGFGSLSPGASNGTSWNRSSDATVTKVDCSGKCLGIGVTGSCKSGEACWL
jgi:flagellin-like protein